MRRLLKRWAEFARDEGVAGLIIAMIIAAVAFTAFTVFVSKSTGPIRDLAKAQQVGENQKVVQSALIARFNQQATLPCPDTDLNGTENTPCAAAVTSGTLPWSTLGIAQEDVIDAYGTYYTYVVAGADRGLCVSVGNDYDGAAAAEFTGETTPLTDLQVRETGAGSGTFVPMVLISHGKNRLGGISESGDDLANPTTTYEDYNGDPDPAIVYTGPYSREEATYFDDIVWAPTTSEISEVCEQSLAGEQINADLSEGFDGADGDVDADLFDTTTALSEVQQEGGQAIFDDADAYMTTQSTYNFAAQVRPVYVSAEWTPQAAGASFSIITRAEQTPDGTGLFDPGLAFTFTGAGGISITNNAVSVGGYTVVDAAFTYTAGETYLLEAYDDGVHLWIRITETDDPTNNRAYAYSTSAAGLDVTGTRVAFVNEAAVESRIDNIVVGRPMLAMDTYGTGYAESDNDENGTGTGTITLEGWFKPRSLPSGVNTATLISQWDTGTSATSSFRLYMSSGGALSLALGDGGAPVTQTLDASLSADAWQHVAVTYDDDVDADGEITVYIDGDLVNTITAPTFAGATIRSAAEHFVVGANLNGAAGQNVFDGAVSDVRVWNVARSASQISSYFKHRLPVVDVDPDATLDGLIVNWRFDRESGGINVTTILDTPSALGEDGDLIGAADYIGTLMNFFRPVSTDVCPSGRRVGAYRCDFRADGHDATIDAEDLAGMSSFGVKIWGAGGGAFLDGGGVALQPGGGGGFASGQVLNTGEDLAIVVGLGGVDGSQGATGTDSTVDYGGNVGRGNGGQRANNGTNPGNGGSGQAFALLLGSYAAPAATAPAAGCNPQAVTCGDPDYNTTGTGETNPGLGGSTTNEDGNDGAVVLIW